VNPLCVIPARRDSKRLPLKNLLSLGGKPMVAYSIDCALRSGVFDKVFVSTEDEEIAAIAKQYGADVHRRPIGLSGDRVSATEVCLDVLEAQAKGGENFGAIVCLQPTSPLRNPHDIQGAWYHFCSTQASYLVSVTPIDPHYFHWAVHQNGDWCEMFFKSKYLKERLDLPGVFRPNGSIKIGLANDLRLTKNFFGKQMAVYETPEERSVHVATKFDFDLADFLLQKREMSVPQP
jgi:CMP-N-acetylneuraminic acid synthetase